MYSWVNSLARKKIKLRVLLSLAVAGLLLFYLRSGNAADMAGRFMARQYLYKNNFSISYRLLVPNNYDASKKYPLIIFLHGSDERGTDNLKQLYVGLDIFAAESMMQRYPCFIAAPQCPNEMKWADADWKAERHIMKKNPTEALSSTMELARELPKEFSIDTSRIYVVGYSMGGFGVWEAVQRWPDLIAAAVPVCGGGDEVQAPRIARIPIWAFHGALDPTVKSVRSRNMINAVILAGGMPRYTEYPNINHFSWGLAFADPALFEWLFKQKK
jgi:predicted peptidase